MNALEYLKQEHVKATSKFGEIESGSPAERGALWMKLQPELELHEQIERMHLYGPVSRADEARGTRLEEWDKQHTEQVGEIKDVMQAMDGLDASGEEWLRNLSEVKSHLEQHIQEEETEIWPEIRRIWDDARLSEAGSKMHEMHAEKMKTAS